MLIDISKYLKEYKKVKLKKTNTLFEVKPDWNRVKELGCPYCKNKLRRMGGNKGYYCSSKKHERFFITEMALNKIISPNR